MTKKPVVAILGATGAVGQEFIRLIEERNFPYSQLKLLASYRSAGKKMTVNGQEYTIEEAKPESFDGVDIGLFAGGSISKELGPEAAKRGCVVIDNSSTFRMDPEVPLVVPEVNPEDIAWHKNIIANPNDYHAHGTETNPRSVANQENRGQYLSGCFGSWQGRNR